MKSSPLLPALIVPFIVWRVYMRARRNIGRQHLKPKKLIGWIVIFSLASLGLAGLAMAYHPASLGGLAGGLLLGVPLALLGLHLTQFEATAEGRFYTPNTYMGIMVTLLLVGRVVYRFLVLSSAPADGQPPPSLFQSPLTFVVFGITAGYYIAYYTGVLIRAKRPDLAAVVADSGESH